MLDNLATNLTTNQVINQNNTDLTSSLLPIQSIKENIVLPFYFSHRRYDPNKSLDEAKLKEQIDLNVKTFVHKFNEFRNKDHLHDIAIKDFAYEEIYTNINCKKHSHPFSYLFTFHDEDYLSKSFDGFDLHLYYDAEHDVLSGGYNLKLKTKNDTKFGEVLKRVYLANFIEYFTETYFIPEITLNFPDLIVSKTSSSGKEINLYDHNANVIPTLVQDRLYNAWKELVSDKFSEEDHDFLNNNFFFSLTNTLLLMINILNAIRLLCCEYYNINYDLKEKQEWSGTLSTNDYLFLWKLLNQLRFDPRALINQKKQTKDYSKNEYFKELNDYKRIKISFLQFFYFHNIVFEDQINNWITNERIVSMFSQDQVHKIDFVMNSLLNSAKFMLSIKSKSFLSLKEFLTMSNQLLIDDQFNKENQKDVRDCKFFSNNHFAAYNNENYLLLCSTKTSISAESAVSLNYFYVISLLYFGSFYVTFNEIDNYANFVIANGYNHKNLAYRNIIRDLKIINLDFLNNFYGIESMKYIVKRINTQYDLQKKVADLIVEVRNEDEADKLVVERNSIATAFICALFIGIIWFVDQCFASWQSTGSGNTNQGQIGALPFNVVLGFVGLATFVTICVTVILAYQLTKLYLTWKRTKDSGLLNMY